MRTRRSFKVADLLNLPAVQFISFNFGVIDFPLSSFHGFIAMGMMQAIELGPRATAEML